MIWNQLRLIGIHLDHLDTQRNRNIKTKQAFTQPGLSPQWSLVCDAAWEVHIAKFALVVGSSFGYLVFGILADW